MDSEPVTHTTTDRRLGHLPSGRDVSVTVHRYTGGDGPTLYVQAAQHGIELNGPAALRRLHDRLREAAVAGTVVVVPVANPVAFDHRSYLTPEAYDALNSNFNRIWPGDREGSFQEQLVANLWPLVESADAAVDLHTGMPEMLEHVRYRERDGDARELAAAFGTDYLLAGPEPDGADTVEGSETAEGEPGGSSIGDDFAGKFRAAATRIGVPTITAELSNSRTVGHDAVETGAAGVWNVLSVLDMVAEPPASHGRQQVLRDDAPRVAARASGLFERRSDLAVGDDVAADDELGAVFDPASFERLETITAPADGVVYSAPRGGVVVAGERLASLATRVRVTD
ncbi:MAG: succinylglutamate desuccinylase/aspartoacylase family protein [Haloquadratum sp.]